MRRAGDICNLQAHCCKVNDLTNGPINVGAIFSGAHKVCSKWRVNHADQVYIKELRSTSGWQFFGTFQKSGVGPEPGVAAEWLDREETGLSLLFWRVGLDKLKNSERPVAVWSWEDYCGPLKSSCFQQLLGPRGRTMRGDAPQRPYTSPGSSILSDHWTVDGSSRTGWQKPPTICKIPSRNRRGIVRDSVPWDVVQVENIVSQQFGCYFGSGDLGQRN